MLAYFLFDPQLKIAWKLTEFELPETFTWLLKFEVGNTRSARCKNRNE